MRTVVFCSRVGTLHFVLFFCLSLTLWLKIASVRCREVEIQIITTEREREGGRDSGACSAHTVQLSGHKVTTNPRGLEVTALSSTHRHNRDDLWSFRAGTGDRLGSRGREWNRYCVVWPPLAAPMRARGGCSETSAALHAWQVDKSWAQGRKVFHKILCF